MGTKILVEDLRIGDSMFILHFLFILFAARTLVNIAVKGTSTIQCHTFDLTYIYFCNLPPFDLEYLTLINIAAQS